MADVLDAPAGGGHAEVLPQVGAAEGQPDSHLVARGDDAVDLALQVREAALAATSLARMGLTEARAHLIWELRKLGPCPQRTLAAALRVTPRAVTALVDGLVETGFVTREPCPTDRRATLVTFTELGRSTAQTLADSHRELARQLFSGMSAGEFGGSTPA